VGATSLLEALADRRIFVVGRDHHFPRQLAGLSIGLRKGHLEWLIGVMHDHQQR
jgi:hypothetical protein